MKANFSNSHTKPLSDILDDENVPLILRKQAERVIYKDHIIVNGQLIYKNRQSLVEYYIKNYCRELTRYEDFQKGYNIFLDELGLSDEKNLKITGHTYEHLRLLKCILWNQGQRFRYYDIKSRDFNDFLETINISQYDGLEISTLKLFRENSTLMEEYNIYDEYELHNLLKKIWCESDKRVIFKRMPTIEIGNVNRDNQVWSLLLQCAPISPERFASLYEDIYGVKAPYVTSMYMKNFAKYLFNGEYVLDLQDLPENEYVALHKILTEDYYTLRDIQRIYLREFPSADIAQINSYTLKTLGFRSHSSYVVRDTYASAADYFNSILTGQDIIDMRRYPKSIQYSGAYTGEMYRLRREREIVEFGYCQYIHIRKLNQFGVTKEMMEDYCKMVSCFVEQGNFFTIRSIVSDGFSHPLDSLGFDEVFYSAVLIEDREHFSYQRLGGTRVFVNGTNKNIVTDMLIWLVCENNNKLDIYDLRDLLENHYGIVISKDKLIYIIRSTDMYYDSIMEAVYIDYDTYLEEI